jgi:hypothetical protein
MVFFSVRFGIGQGNEAIDSEAQLSSLGVELPLEFPDGF